MSTYPKKPTIGIWFPDHAGQTHNDFRVLKLATEWGWVDTDAAAMIEAGEGNLTEHQDEILSETVDDAIEWLNAQETRSFMYWAFVDGSFGLFANAEGAKEDCGFVSSKRNEYPPDDYEGEWLHVNDHGNATLYAREDQGVDAEGKRQFKDREIWSAV